MTNVHLPESHVDFSPLPGFGRLISIDPEDQNYLMAAEAPIEVTRTVAFWETGPVLDQGQTSECTAYSGEQLLTSGPVKNNMYLTPHELYRLNQLNDEWDAPGESEMPGGYAGSSVRATMKVLQAAGLITKYVWAFDVDPVRRWLLMRGPVVVGTNWYADMMKPDKRTGFIRPKGRPVGGHAYMLRGADDNLRCPDGSKGAARILNSWSEKWGQQGKAWISYRDLDGLIKNHGEAVTPVEFLTTTPIIITGKIEEKK
jgi:hypothetical protein